MGSDGPSTNKLLPMSGRIVMPSSSRANNLRIVKYVVALLGIHVPLLGSPLRNYHRSDLAGPTD